VPPILRATITPEVTAAKKVLMTKRGSVVDAPVIGTQSGLGYFLLSI